MIALTIFLGALIVVFVYLQVRIRNPWDGMSEEAIAYFQLVLKTTEKVGSDERQEV